MKRTFFFFALSFFLATTLSAQDDMYFLSSKKKIRAQEAAPVERVASSERSRFSEDEIDRYNRQGYYLNDDTLYVGDGEPYAPEAQSSYDEYDNGCDYDCSFRIARFHNPSITFVCGLPAYYDPFDYYWDVWPYRWWGYGSFYDPFVYPYYRPYYSYYRPYFHYHPGGYPSHYVRPLAWRNSGGRRFQGTVSSVRRGAGGGVIVQGGRNYRSRTERTGTSVQRQSVNSRPQVYRERVSTARANQSREDIGTSQRNMGTVRQFRSSSTPSRGNVSTGTSSGSYSRGSVGGGVRSMGGGTVRGGRR